jgi:hypothetical protein
MLISISCVEREKMEDIVGPIAPLPPAPRSPAVTDVARELWLHVDWTRCAAGGSYALQQYTRDPWPKRNPDDIDIHCQVDTPEELRAMAEAMVASSNRVTYTEFPEEPSACITKFTVITPEMRTAHWKELGGEERFHESIIATAKLQMRYIPLPVQLVGMDTTSNVLGKAPLLEHLALICDLPASVAFTVQNGKKIFHVPERALRSLQTKQVHINNICAARRVKYEERGYSFYGRKNEFPTD